MFPSSLIVFLAVLLPAFVHAADVNVAFNIDNSVVAPDGFSRAGVIVNGVYPGTLIQANKDDTLHITTNNQLTDSTMRCASMTPCDTGCLTFHVSLQT